MSEQEQYSPIAFLGLVADYKRTLKDGSQYDKYFPKADMSYDVVTNNGNVHRTVQDMDKYCRETVADTAKIAPLLIGKTLQETLKNNFNFVYSHIQYKLDKDGIEELRRPRRLWADRVTGGDCDCMAIFIGSLLLNQNINFKFRITKYNAGWQHVYVVVPLPNNPQRYYVIDCVLNEFNEEKTFTDKFDHTMNSPQTFLGGIPLARLGEVGDAVINVAQDKEYLLSGGHFEGVEIDALGTVEGNSPMLKAIYDHIVATRDIIRKDPNAMDIAGGAESHLAMLDHAIAKWNTPERDAALDLLEKEEERWNETTEKNGAISGTNGIDDIEVGFTSEENELIEGLGRFRFSLKGKGKTFFRNINKAVKAVVAVNRAIIRKVGTAVKKDIAKIQAVAKKVGAVIKKFVMQANPLFILARAGFLLAMKVNLFQWAQRAYPSYFSLEEANKMGITKAAWELSQKGRAVLEAKFAQVGGSASKLEHNIKTGRAAKMVARQHGLHGLGVAGYDDAVLLISAAGTLISTAAGLAKSGMNNQAYAAAQKQHDAAVTQQMRIKYANQRAIYGLGEDGDPATTTGDPPVESPDVKEEDATQKTGAFHKFIAAIKKFFSRKKAADEPAIDPNQGAAITTTEQAAAADPAVAADSVVTIAKQKSQDAYDEAIASGSTTAQALEAGQQAAVDAGGDSTVSANGGLMDFVKNNPVKVGLGALAAAALITLAISPKARQAIGIGSKAKPKAALSGLENIKKQKAKKSKSTLPSASKVMRVVLK